MNDYDKAPKDVFGDIDEDLDFTVDINDPRFDEFDLIRDRLSRRRTNVAFLIEHGFISPEDGVEPLRIIDEEDEEIKLKEARLIFDPTAIPDGPHTPYVNPKPNPLEGQE
jgi:hypothetical protein